MWVVELRDADFSNGRKYDGLVVGFLRARVSITLVEIGLPQLRNPSLTGL